MSRYSVAATSPELTDLIDRALGGDEVVITREGTPIAELRIVNTADLHPVGSTEWLVARARRRPRIGMTALELLDKDAADEAS